MPESFKDAYHRRYDQLKKAGEPFFPDVIFKDTVMALFVFLLVLMLAAFAGVPMDPQADPSATGYVPRPEWYFLFLFQMLKYFPGKLEFVGALLVPTGFIVLLLVLPFVDRNPARRYRRRPLALAASGVILGVIVMLGVLGAIQQPPAVTGIASAGSGARLTPFERAGLQVYEQNSCQVCHQINGTGGAIGPDLSTVGRRLDAGWLVRHLQSPQTTSPGTKMPQFAFTNEDLMALTAYLLTLLNPSAPTGPSEGPLNASAQAGKSAFGTYCNACHPGGAAGIGPNLFGPTFNKTYSKDAALAQFVRTGKGSMPSFSASQISDSQLQDIIAYLRALKAPTQ
jgi:mono/diheme cytochrome c family protein